MGIRNRIIDSFNTLELRSDIGALWENFCIAERRKKQFNHLQFTPSYFWRTYTQKEVDYVEEENEKITGYEFKWQAKPSASVPKDFIQSYNATVQQIHRENFLGFV